MRRAGQLAKYLILTALLALAAPAASAAAPANPMHPAFKLLDARGNLLRQGGKDLDQVRTCGQCHEASFITGHTLAGHQQIKADCLSCHYQGGKAGFSAAALEPDGTVKRDWLRLARPTAANCGACHGLTAAAGSPVAIPGDYRAAAYPAGGQGQTSYDLTRLTGSIFSLQELAASYLNLSDKPALHFSWDIHAQKMVQCTDCHYAPNNPRRFVNPAGGVAGLRFEPRREAVSEYLQEPDHRLATADCRTCHDPGQGHGFLPYPERHLEAVACESCHIPRQYGPAERMVDATLLDETGSPLVEYHGVKGEPVNLNTAYNRGFEPPLLALPQPGKPGGPPRLTPVNLVSRWYWTSGGSPEPISRETLARALLLNGHYRPELLAALDANHDGRIERDELKLDTAAKQNAVEKLLVAAGVKDPAIRGEVSLHRLSHGVSERGQALSDCVACHGPRSRIKDQVVLASRTPGGVPPQWRDQPPVSGRIDTGAGGQVVWRQAAPAPEKLYVFGLTAGNWPDRLGLLMLLGVVLMVAGHGGYRLMSRRGHAEESAATSREYLFSAYERLWHWLMALSVIVLIITGLQIHFPGRVVLFGAAGAVTVHNFFAVVLMLNAFLALFYHLTTAAIRQFLPPRQGMADAVRRQARYYLRDIFKGLPAPFPRSPERKLNVLQQLTYLFLLNVLFPWQIITGALIWLAGHYPAWAAALGGLHLIAPLHNLGSWMFISFLVAHVYLSTTGHTALAHVRGMIEGYEEVAMPSSNQGEKI